MDLWAKLLSLENIGYSRSISAHQYPKKDRQYLVPVHKVSILRRGCIENLDSRLAKAEIGEFTEVNDPLEDKHHKEVGLYRRMLLGKKSHKSMGQGKGTVYLIMEQKKSIKDQSG